MKSNKSKVSGVQIAFLASSLFLLVSSIRFGNKLDSAIDTSREFGNSLDKIVEINNSTIKAARENGTDIQLPRYDDPMASFKKPKNFILLPR